MIIPVYSDNEKLTMKVANFFKQHEDDLYKISREMKMDKAEEKGIDGASFNSFKEGIDAFYGYFEGAKNYVENKSKEAEEKRENPDSDKTE